MTVEKPYGWIFFYTSKEWLETGGRTGLIAGNGPVVVEREDGSLHPLTTAFDPETAIRQYEARRHGKLGH